MINKILRISLLSLFLISSISYAAVVRTGGGGGSNSGGTPGGTSPQLQYNNAGAFGGATGSGVDSNGNVGIGTLTPTSKLSVFDTLQDSGIDITGMAVANGIDSNAKLMLHLNNNVTDSISSPNTVTNNNATFSNSIYKFDGYSALFNGTNAYLDIANQSLVPIGTSDFTVDFWINWVAFTGNHMFSQIVTNNVNQFTFFMISSSDFRIRIDSASSVVANMKWNPSALSTGTWYHFAFVRQGTSNWYFFVNGVSQGAPTLISGSLSGSAPSLATDWLIGGNNITSNYINAYIDEFRVSNIARWTSDFTPATSAYGSAINQNRIRFNDSSTQTWNITSDGNDSDKLKFSNGIVGTNDRMTLTTGGNLGIGTTITNNGGLLVMNGNVGIGTWIPVSKLDVVGSVCFSGSGCISGNQSKYAVFSNIMNNNGGQ